MGISYYYLLSSLPLLEFGEKPPFSYHDFLDLCKEHLSIRHFQTVRNIKGLSPETLPNTPIIFREWKIFDKRLRQVLAWSRAAKYEKDLALRLQSELYEDLSLMRFAQWATHQDSPFEAELSVDRVRWEKIEDLRKSHFFDLEHLISYAMQVRILERWERIRMTGDPKILRELMEKVVNHD